MIFHCTINRLKVTLIPLHLQSANSPSSRPVTIHFRKRRHGDHRPQVETSWNAMAHAQKPDFVFRRNGRVHLNRLGRQFSRLLAAEVCAPAVVMLDIPCSEVVWEYWLPTPFASYPFTSPPVRHREPSHFNWSLP